jgi:xylose isomerase
LKNLAVAFLHPERPVMVSDPTVFGRNYFSRPSAIEQKTDEEADEEVDILEDARALKMAAVAYLHPEIGVTSTDGACFGRNYFNRPSAPEVESVEEANERARVLEETAALKKLAIDYMHPEVGVTSTDGACYGRNYFNRYSAPDAEDAEVADERARILSEAAALKKLVIDYMHPEVGVTSTDGACFGRNYFNRPSAPETEEDEFADERAEILAEASALKKLAVDYMHPEIGVTSTDGACFGRNYFNRFSAPETEDVEVADERARILSEAAALKKSAIDYMHPEVGVATTDATLFGRNYFIRPSAPGTDEDEFADERAEILAEAVALKKLAVDYLHPEVGVTFTDATRFGRNYFSRPSAPETEDVEVADERARVLAEASALKKLAIDYMHPEIGVTSANPTVFGRNYFNRPSAPEIEEDEYADERAEILAECAALKKLAVDYLHPEVGVTSTDGECFGRNYFNRPSAPETEDVEDADERARILAEAAALKKLAIDYMHPEVGVTSTDGACFGRNYFNRYSAPDTEDVEVADERARVLAECAALKKSAVDYMHPEVGVKTTDSTAFGRNYFNQEASALEKLAAAVKGAKLPSTKSSSSDNDLGNTKKSASSVNLFGLTEDVV